MSNLSGGLQSRPFKIRGLGERSRGSIEFFRFSPEELFPNREFEAMQKDMEKNFRNIVFIKTLTTSLPTDGGARERESGSVNNRRIFPSLRF